MDSDAFDCFYRGYVESCIAGGVEPRTREYAPGLIAMWERMFQTPACALASPPDPSVKQ